MKAVVNINRRGETLIPLDIFKQLTKVNIHKPYPKKNRSIKKKHKARKGARSATQQELRQTR